MVHDIGEIGSLLIRENNGDTHGSVLFHSFRGLTEMFGFKFSRGRFKIMHTTSFSVIKASIEFEHFISVSRHIEQLLVGSRILNDKLGTTVDG